MMYLVVLVTCPGEKEAEIISRSLLKERLAACVNVVPNLTSFFWWNKKVHKSGEVLLMIKTKKKNLREIVKNIKQEHQYENPEVIALPIVGGSKEYMQWIEEETK